LLVVKNGLNGSGILCRMDPIVLYVDGFWNSPYAFSVFICLKEKGLPFALREVNLHEKAQKTPEFQAKSLTARVPVLEHGAFRLSESSAIVEYLEEAFAPPRCGDAATAPRDRARARQIMAWIWRLDADPRGRPRTRSSTAPGGAAVAGGEGDRGQVDRGGVAFIPDGRTSLFDAFSIADADLAMMLERLVGNNDPVPASCATSSPQWRGERAGSTTSVRLTSRIRAPTRCRDQKRSTNCRRSRATDR
jgi:glutathione S-transferase